VRMAHCEDEDRVILDGSSAIRMLSVAATLGTGSYSFGACMSRPRLCQPSSRNHSSRV
jgi:hypothetical protein